MAKNTGVKDPWKQASSAAIWLLSLPYDKDKIGKWSYEREAGRKEQIRFWTSEAIDGFVQFTTISEYAKEKPSLMQLAYWENRIRRSWSSDEIRQINGMFENTRPKIEYAWGVEIENGVPTARLSFLRVDLAGDTFVNYEARRKWQYWMRDEKALPAGLPESLTGIDQILGQAIPWEIDFSQTAQEFLDKTRLEEFAKVVRAYQG